MLVGGLVALGSYKMSKKDADRIEKDSDVSPEEMTDEELEASMAKLGIEKQTRTAADVEEGQAAAQTTTTPARTAAPTSSAPGSMSAIQEIEQLADLHKRGILTDEEFAARKKQILGL